MPDVRLSRARICINCGKIVVFRGGQYRNDLHRSVRRRGDGSFCAAASLEAVATWRSTAAKIAEAARSAGPLRG